MRKHTSAASLACSGDLAQLQSKAAIRSASKATLLPKGVGACIASCSAGQAGKQTRGAKQPRHHELNLPVVIVILFWLQSLCWTHAWHTQVTENMFKRNKPRTKDFALAATTIAALRSLRWRGASVAENEKDRNRIPNWGPNRAKTLMSFEQ